MPVEALREHRVRQAEDRLAAGPLWQDHGLVFASTVGTPQDDHNVRRQFRGITEASGLACRWPSHGGMGVARRLRARCQLSCEQFQVVAYG